MLPAIPGTIRCSTRRCWQRRIFSPGQADANEQLDLAQADSSRLASSEHYPLHKLRQIHSALRQRQLNLPLWLLSWNTLTGDTRDTNGRFFRGALLMDNLLGVADQVWLAGFWLNSGLQGEARANGKLDTSSLALHYLHGLAAPGLLGTLALAAAARRDPGSR